VCRQFHARTRVRGQEVVSAVRRLLFTNTDNTLHAHWRQQPNHGADSSSRDSDSGSNVLHYNIGSNGPGSDMGNTVHGNNKPKLAPEQNRQRRAAQQIVAEEDFS